MTPPPGESRSLPVLEMIFPSPFQRKCDSRLSAAHIRLEKFPTVSRIEGGAFSKCDSHLCAARIRLKHVQELCG
eukprot:100862-Pyramimonas_sp.AAC.1